MLEKPDIQDDRLIDCLRQSYGLDFNQLEFLPLGNDPAAWVYRVHAESDSDYFLKVKKGAIKAASVQVPRYLKDQGIKPVVAPLYTRSQSLWAEMDGFTLMLYPLIDGGTGFETGLSDDQWTEYGAVLRQIHATRLAPPLVQQVPEEAFWPQYGPVVRALMAHRNAENDGYARELSAFWQTRHDEILAIVARAEALGQMLQQKPADLVVCHADIHRYNTLIDHSGKLHIIDWDETLLAPKERDLMFVVNGAATSTRSHEEFLFFRGYGDCEVDALALAYYRYEWVVQEISDFGERIFSRGDLGASSKADALQEFIQLFDAGDVVEAAYQADAELQSSRKA